jgi:hypothetical protein
VIASARARRSRAGAVLAYSLVLFLVAAGVCGSLRVAWVATVRVGPQIRADQVTYLQRPTERPLRDSCFIHVAFGSRSQR